MKLVSVGSILKEQYFKPSGLSITELAYQCNTSAASLSRVMNDKAELTVELAMKLEKVFKRKAETWLIHQVKYSLQEKGYYDED